MTTMRPTGRLKCAFTLIELLVVIAIIAILASLLFPALGSARRSAQFSGCRGHLKQLGAGFILFASDHGGRLPSGQGDPSGNWNLRIGPYVGGIPSVNNPLKVLRCPAHQGPLAFEGQAGMRDHAVGSYAALTTNAQILNNPNENTKQLKQRVFLAWFGSGVSDVDMRPLSMVPKPAGTGMLTELATDENDQAGYYAVLLSISLQIGPNCNGAQDDRPNANNVTLILHDGRVNYLFADGHVADYVCTDPSLYSIWSVHPGD